MWFLINNIDSHSIECAIYNVYKHRVLRLRSTDWKSSLSHGTAVISVVSITKFSTVIGSSADLFVKSSARIHVGVQLQASNLNFL